jgi:hypothetical protein
MPFPDSLIVSDLTFSVTGVAATAFLQRHKYSSLKEAFEKKLDGGNGRAGFYSLITLQSLVL